MKKIHPAMVVRRRLRCGLPVFLAFCFCGDVAAGDRQAGETVSPTALQAVLASNARASWTTAVPLRSALTSLAEQQKFTFFLDRRIDPSKRVEGDFDAPVPTILQALGEEGGFSHTLLRSVVYLGPAATTRKLQTIDRLRIQELRKLPSNVRRRMVAESPLKWETLSTPREVIGRLAQSMGARIVEVEKVPHDLWREGRLPAMPRLTQLTVLLAGFNLTFDVLADGSLRIRPISDADVWVQSYPISSQQQGIIERLQQALPDTEFQWTDRQLHVAAQGIAKDSSEQLYSLRVVRKPVRQVLEQIAAAAKLQLQYDHAAINRAGRSVDTSVTFAVKDATLQELLTATTDAAGLQYALDGTAVRITAGQ